MARRTAVEEATPGLGVDTNEMQPAEIRLGVEVV
jgi:hypothetical protein